MTGPVRCEIAGCHNRATVHVLHPMRRVCSVCAAELRFPRVACMLEATRVADALRSAATELEELAGSAPAYELSTLRRKVRAVIVGVAAFAERES